MDQEKQVFKSKRVGDGVKEHSGKGFQTRTQGQGMGDRHNVYMDV